MPMCRYIETLRNEAQLAPHSVNNKPVKRLTTPISGQAATGLLYCTASDAIFITQNWDVG